MRITVLNLETFCTKLPKRSTKQFLLKYKSPQNKVIFLVIW